MFTSWSVYVCKPLHLIGCSHIPVAEITVRGINPFPCLYRRDSLIVNCLPILNQTETINTPLREATEPVTLMVTGPLTTVAVALDAALEIEAKIKQIVWMGGALNVPGNVEKSIESGQNGMLIGMRSQLKEYGKLKLTS